MVTLGNCLNYFIQQYFMYSEMCCQSCSNHVHCITSLSCRDITSCVSDQVLQYQQKTHGRILFKFGLVSEVIKLSTIGTWGQSVLINISLIQNESIIHLWSDFSLLDFKREMEIFFLPVMVAEWAGAWTVLAQLDARIVGSNPTEGMDVYVYVYVYSMLHWEPKREFKKKLRSQKDKGNEC
jgi:hypothetical protein